MAAIGRLLQVIGWLWLVGGFVLPALGWADITVFPGLILIFVARALRTQAARNAPPEDEQEPLEERILNTDRVRVEPQRPPKPPPPSPQPVSIPRQSEPPRPKPTPAAEKESLIERIAESGREVEADLRETVHAPIDVTAPRGAAKPLSSEEMIAAARRRWNTDKRPGRS
jgi:hypothetical protein